MTLLFLLLEVRNPNVMNARNTGMYPVIVTKNYFATIAKEMAMSSLNVLDDIKRNQNNFQSVDPLLFKLNPSFNKLLK